MFTVEQLRQLTSFSSDRYPLSTFYWKAPATTNSTHREEAILIRDLLREGRQKLETSEQSREWFRSLDADQQKMADYFSHVPNWGTTNVALFSCSGESKWQVVTMPRGLQSGFFAGESFYVQPLSVLLDQYPRYCAVIADRNSARIFEIYMGAIEERTAVFDDVPGKVKAATWTGGNERQIERRTENKAQQHYKRVAEQVLEYFKKYRFDWLILLGHADGLAAFENHLHSYLKAHLVGRGAADVKTATLPEILSQSLEIVKARECQEKQALVEEILNKANHNKLGVIGLADTLRALELGQVHTLVVDDSLRVSAWRCRECGTLRSAEAPACAACGGPLDRLEDVAEQAVQLAIQDNSQIRFIGGCEGLRQAGGIGALLRFRAGELSTPTVS